MQLKRASILATGISSQPAVQAVGLASENLQDMLIFSVSNQGPLSHHRVPLRCCLRRVACGRASDKSEKEGIVVE